MAIPRGKHGSPTENPAPADASLCESNTCTERFVDVDGDGFGFVHRRSSRRAAIGGDDPAANRPDPFVTPGACRGNDVEFPYVPLAAWIRGGGWFIAAMPNLRVQRHGLVSPRVADFSNEFLPGANRWDRREWAPGARAARLGRDRNCDGDETAVSLPRTE